MQILRSSLLWASQSPRMERMVRSSRAMRPLVSRFMPGESLDDVIAAVNALKAQRTPTIITHLGENVSSDAAADVTVHEYERLIADLASTQSGADISIKLTQFGWDVDQRRALMRVSKVAGIAAAHRMTLAIDMESSAYVESTIGAYEKLAREHANVALCLQAYLHRTPGDLRRLLPMSPHIRLVKGAYREPASAVLTKRADIDSRYRVLARELLSAAGAGARVVFGSHDMALIQTIRADARELGVPHPSFEVQMLFGIQDSGRRMLAAEGVPTRVLISYGKAWYPWFMRRLAEKPSNLTMIARNLLP
jgi:proline dehydrogenase